MKKLNKKMMSLMMMSLAMIVAVVSLITPAYANTTSNWYEIDTDGYASLKAVSDGKYVLDNNGNGEFTTQGFVMDSTEYTSIEFDRPMYVSVSNEQREFISNEVLTKFEIKVTYPEGQWENFTYNFYANGNKLNQQSGDAVYVIEFTFANFRPAISGSDVVLNDIDKPYTIEQIKQIANLKAHDQYYGDLTDDIEITEDTYSANMNKVGNFRIVFSITNSSGLSATTTLNVVNKDIVAPVLTGPSTSSNSYKTTLTSADIIDKYRVSDNYDKDLEIKIENTNYVAGQVGTFTFNLTAKDSSGNTARATHTVTVFDDVKPTIVDKHIDPIVLNWKQEYKQDDLLIDLSASDEIDGNITNKIRIKSSDFKSGVVGSYTVIFEVSDNAGNTAEATRVYVIETTDNPVFFVSKNMLLIEDVNKMTVEQIINEMAKYEKFDVASYTIMVDTYTGNELTAGTYEVAASLSLNTGETVQIRRNVRVFNLSTSEQPEPQPEPQPEIELPWYKVAWNHVVNFFIWLANIVNYIINFFDKSWGILPYVK